MSDDMQAPQELFRNARQAMSMGQNEAAREIFNQILQKHPNSAETLFQLGRLDLQEGQPKRAKRHLQKALRLARKQPEIWYALMDAEIALRDAKGVKKLFSAARAAKLPPKVLKQLASKAQTGNRQGVANLNGVSAAEFERARAAYMTGDFKLAEQTASKLLKRAPKNAPLQAIRAASLAQMGEIPMARRAYEKAIAIDPEYMEARMQLGQLLTGINAFDGALPHLTKALEMAPESPHVHLAMGVLMTRMNNTKKAIEHLEFASKYLSNEPRLYLFLSKAYHAEARHEDATEALARVEEKELSLEERVERIGTFLDLDKLDEAKAQIEALAQAHPDSPAVLRMQARIYTNAGEIDKMRQTVRKLIDLKAAGGDLLLSYARSSKLSRDDPAIAEIERLLKEDAGESTETRYSLAFAMAKLHDDWGDYKTSFAYLKRGNDAQARETTPRLDASSRSFERGRSVYERSRDIWREQNATGYTDASPRAILVTGMPRSGTTLVEQIISSHSIVEPGGELGIVNSRMDEPLKLLALKERPMSPGKLAEIGEDITNAFADMFPGAQAVTDKGIMANIHAGIFRHALPNGRMVVLKRDPRDNCLSMYKNRFAKGTHSYTTDLEALARQYLKFLDIQAYWREHEPDAFYEIRYEDLVENPEEETRRLIDYCDLEWEDACLEFYKNKRQVKTLSAYQVRQKLYSSSIGAWKNYEEELQPLIRILDEGGALEGY